GIEGIFHGPIYYYLIAPFYLISQGDPAWAAAFVGILAALGLIFVYLIGKEFNPWVGLVSAFILAISYNWIRSDRWLSNPTPLAFFIPLTIYLFYKGSLKAPLESSSSSSAYKSLAKPKLFIIAAFFLGLCLQFEAAGGIFNLIAVI